MRVEIRASIYAVAAAVMLVACASKAPVNPKSADASAQDDTSTEYKRLAENATQGRVCKRQAVVGSRIDSVVCVTPEELKAQREHAADVMRDIQASVPMDRQGPPAPPPPPSSPPK
jgi:hypothetical protein